MVELGLRQLIHKAGIQCKKSGCVGADCLGRNLWCSCGALGFRSVTLHFSLLLSSYSSSWKKETLFDILKWCRYCWMLLGFDCSRVVMSWEKFCPEWGVPDSADGDGLSHTDRLFLFLLVRVRRGKLPFATCFFSGSVATGIHSRCLLAVLERRLVSSWTQKITP